MQYDFIQEIWNVPTFRLMSDITSCLQYFFENSWINFITYLSCLSLHACTTCVCLCQWMSLSCATSDHMHACRMLYPRAGIYPGMPYLYMSCICMSVCLELFFGWMKSQVSPKVHQVFLVRLQIVSNVNKAFNLSILHTDLLTCRPGCWLLLLSVAAGAVAVCCWFRIEHMLHTWLHIVHT